MVLTRFRIPVSTSLLLLGLFATEAIDFLGVVKKSLNGYLIAFLVAFLFYFLI
jgi:hypothetical protein